MTTYDLADFGHDAMTECGARLRLLGDGAASMEEVARRIVGHFHERFLSGPRGERQLVLARLFGTLPYHDLEQRLKLEARERMAGERPGRGTRCLTLLATSGERPEWNDRHLSARHAVIPFMSAAFLAQFPMLSQLIQQCGFDLGALLEPDRELLLDLEQRTYNVFHVAEAKGSPWLPAQESFVVPYAVRSVIGFGGLMPSGDLFATILFSRAPISRETANRFAPLALSAKMALLPFVGRAVFTAEGGRG